MAARVIDQPVMPESAALEALGTIAATRSGLEARLIEAARLVVATTGAAVLAHKGFTSIEELSEGQRVKWRAETKRAACVEVELALGVGVSEARHLVGLACAPADVRAATVGALDRGEVTWSMVRAFWRRCAALPSQDAAVVADSLFGATPETSVPERLDPDDELRERPWHAGDYAAALEREAKRAEGQDVVAERERRRVAYRARRASLQIHDDGTATLEVTSSVVSMVSAHTRIERAARLLRKQGDPRTLDQLRADAVAALLVHGRLPLPDHTDHPVGAHANTDPQPDEPHPVASSADRAGGSDSLAESTLESPDDDLVAPDLEAMARVICGMPEVQLQVVVPWDALTGRASHPDCRHRGDDASHGEVGFLLGRHPVYLRPGQTRELALLPGTTLSRLLTDPADGRLIERSTSSYRPDAAMRRQILAADVFSRAPGSRQPAAVCEIDHVTPWSNDSTGGATAETNLAALAKRPHDLKTRGLAFTELNTRRDLRWTTLLGRSESTRAHDYRQYSPRSRPATTHSRGAHGRSATTPAHDERRLCVEELRDAIERFAPMETTSNDQAPQVHTDLDGPARPGGLVLQHPSQRADLDDRRDLLCRAFYAALAHRGPDTFLLDADDHPGSGEHGGPLSGWMWVTRTTPSGRRRAGADPETPTLREVLALEAYTDPPDTDPSGPWNDTQDDPPPF